MRADERGRAAAVVAMTWDRPLAARSQQTARFYREPDRRLRKSMAVATVCSALLVAGLLGLVGLKVQQVRLSYRLDALRTARAGAEEDQRRLHVEWESLRSPRRIEERARQLGLVPAAPEQIRLAREFEPGPRGLVGAAGARTAAVQLPGAGAARER